MTDTQHLDQALLAVYRYGNWKQATLRMTDDQREAAADAVQRAGYDNPHVRWWNLTYDRTGKTAVEAFCEAIGKPVPPPLTPEEKAAFDRQMDELDRRVVARYGNDATP
ncbi:hypothetical protein [Plantactinospora sp. WMMB782]|uniref:hypothetical protein n=1 Tax=Plantactinospora sp. WMMB782 TaxID=3404121 RepID=UPI003B933C12